MDRTQAGGAPGGPSRAQVVLGAALAVGLAVASALLPPARTASELREYDLREIELEEVWRTEPRLRDAVERARRAVVRARVTIWHRTTPTGATMTRSSAGSGCIVGGGRLLLLSAHQGSPLFGEAPQLARVTFVTRDGRQLLATVVEHDDEADWAICRIHNPFGVPLDSLELVEDVEAVPTLAAALGYPGLPGTDSQLGVAPGTGRTCRADPDVPGGAWPTADALCLPLRSKGESTLWRLEPPGLRNVPGMSGGPVVDRAGAILGISQAIDRTWWWTDGRPTRIDVSLVVTPASSFLDAYERARRDRESPAAQRIQAIASVAMGLYDGSAAPTSYCATLEECGIRESEVAELEQGRRRTEARLGASLAESGVRLKGLGIDISTFQEERWLEDRLREIAAEGPAALDELRRILDSDLVAPSETLMGACAKSGVTLGLRALRPMLESEFERVRRDGFGHLASVAHDAPGAFRVAVKASEADPSAEVREHAQRSAAQILRRLRDAVPTGSLGDALDRSASVSEDDRFRAVCSLSAHADDAATERLRDLSASDPDPLVRAAALLVLRERR